MLARLAATALAALALSAHAASTTIGFEDVDTSMIPVAFLPGGYQGYDFDGGFGPNTWIVSPSWFPLYSGDEAHSGDNFAWGSGGDGIDMTVTRDGGGTFDFLSLWARGDNPAGLSMTATGYRAGAVVYSQSFVEGLSYSQATLGFLGIDKLTLSMGDGNLLLDDLVVSQPSAVPEPITPALLLAGLGLVGLMARRRRA